MEDLLQRAFFAAYQSECLKHHLQYKEILFLSTASKFLEMFRNQIPIVRIQGSICLSLKHLHKYLANANRMKQQHIHAKLYVDEIDDIDRYLCPSATRSILLEAPTFNWHPYAVLRHVEWLHRFQNIEHLDLSLNEQSVGGFLKILKYGFPCMVSLVVSVNHPTLGIWSSITTMHRPTLSCVSANNFLLEDVSLANIGELKFLWISRPYIKRGHSSFLTNVCQQLPRLVYLSTINFKGLSKKSEMQWMECLQGRSLPFLRIWELEDSDHPDVSTIVQYLLPRQIPLIIQGTSIKEEFILAPPHHRIVSQKRVVSTHDPRIYRVLEVLPHILQIEASKRTNSTIA